MSRPELIDYIKEVTAEVFGISVSDLTGKSRKMEIVDARFTCIQLMVESNINTPSIAKAIGYKHHTSVLHARKDFRNRVKYRGTFFRNNSNKLRELVKLAQTKTKWD